MNSVVATASSLAATVAPVTAGGSWVESGAFWLSFLAVLIALFAAFVGYVTYRSQADPEVIVFAELDRDRSSIMNLIIRNVGKASATDVTFESTHPVPAKAFGIDAATAPEAEILVTGPLVTGISFLPPNGERIITWGQYGGLSKALNGETIWVTAKYKSRHLGAWWDSSHESRCPLEMASFEATDASDRNYVKQIAKEVEQLRNSVDKVAAAVKDAG